jgi:hypothetical protein
MVDQIFILWKNHPGDNGVKDSDGGKRATRERAIAAVLATDTGGLYQGGIGEVKEWVDERATQ